MNLSRLPLFAVALLAAVGIRAQPNPGLMAISVRSGIDSAEKDRRDHDPVYARDSNRARIFVLARVQEEKGRRDLVKPVNAVAIADQLTRELEAHGFHAAQPNQKPGIVITVKYGRGFLPNPYSDSDRDKQHTNLSNSDSLEIWPTHDNFVGLEEKR